MVGIILCLIGTFLFLMIVIAWIFNLSLEANFIISLVIFIIMFIYYVLKDNNSINKANKLNNFKKNIHLDN